jgi:membrane dipeptidase
MKPIPDSLSRRAFLRRLGAGVSAVAGVAELQRMSDASDAAYVADAKVLALHKSIGVFDAYTKPTLKFTRDGIQPGQFVERVEKMQAGMWRLRDGDVRMANMSVGVPRYHRPESPDGKQPTSMPICSVEQETRMVLRQLDALCQSAAGHSRELGIARTVADAKKMNAAGQLALFLHLTGAWIAGDLAVLRSYRQMGVVAIHPCIEGHHAIGDAANEVRMHQGLSAFGREVIQEMNRIRMVVDVAHGSDESIRDMVELSTEPVIYSHGGCRALCDVPRNLTDERIRQIAAKGGVIGIAFVSAMLSDEARQKGGRSDPRYREEFAKAEAELFARCADPYEYMERRADGTFMPGVFRRLGWPPEGHASAPVNRADLERVVDHIEHVTKLVGADHVGIGTDYESGDVPNGLEHAGKLSNLTAALLRRGFSEADVRKILIDNFKRIYRHVLDPA